MVGKFIIILSFVLSLATTVAYFISKDKDDKPNKLGRYLYLAMFLSIVLASGILLSNILSFNYQYTYIWSYSSKLLPLNLLISSFYAGQEGSFLLWTFLISSVGVFLLYYTKKYNFEQKTMAFYTMILVFLTLLLIIKSPFNFIWESFPDVNPDVIPQNGRGLNPVLESYWISIHPPILFTGYALLSVPFALAIAGMFKRDYNNWAILSTPWVLTASAILGFGIMLGGFWAYETLGWGGFWGWDPVENSSLLPWLMSITLVHTLLIQKRTGGLVKTNIILAIFGFIFVLYATFLTRSGVLGDTSVHSFVDPGQLVYLLLLIFLIVFTLIGLVFFFIRFNDMSKVKINLKYDSREFFITLGSVFIVAVTIIVFFGTSLPLFQEILGKPKSAVEISFYNNWSLPLAILMFLTNAFSLYLNWKSSTSMGTALKNSLVSAGISIILTVIVIIAGVKRIDHILLFFSSFFSIVINLVFIFRVGRRKLRLVGSYISHLGLALLLLGALTSSVFVSQKHINLKNTVSDEALGYKFTLVGRDQIQKNMPDREKYKYHLKVQGNGVNSIVSPIIYWSDFNERQAPFFEPGIKRYVTKDLYVSPNGITLEYPYPSKELGKGETYVVPDDTSFKISFIKFDMSAMMGNGGAGHANSTVVPMGAICELIDSNHSTIDTLIAEINMQNGEFNPVMKSIKGKSFKLGFTRFINNPENIALSKVEISVIPEQQGLAHPEEVISFEVSTKPFINLVWLGVIGIVIGLVLTIKKPNIENGKNINK
ncbi:MAG: cytochrome c biogenesis protein CcsA [Ignavibacteriae bacterium]|nr:cytochrome c biogenesis protein CcsA [Ignavibacteriota bacterium]